MYRVLVVDDEKWIRKGIIAVINKNKYNIEKIAEAQNSMEAFEAFNCLKPHILICDVRMPVKDGCTFCEEIIEKYPKTKIIMISGYNEFTYVQRALKYRAADYLLKPINKDELNRVIENVINEIQSELLVQNLTRNASIALENLFVQMIRYPSDIIINQMSEMVKMNIGEFNDFFLINLEFNLQEYEAWFFKNMVEVTLENYFRDDMSFAVFVIQGNHICSVIFRKNESVDGTILVRRLIASLQQKNILQFFVSNSSFYNSTLSLPAAYEETQRQLEGRRIINSNYCSNKTGEYGVLPEKYSILARNAVCAIEMRSTQKLEESFRDMCTGFQTESEMSIKTVKVYFLGILYDCIELLMKEKSFEKNLLQEGMRGSSRILDSYDTGQMQQIVMDFARKVVDRKEEAVQSDLHLIVKEVIEYITLNYREQITLNDIAARYYINSSYFSHMFKEITGESFINYLTAIRIKKAVSLLEDTDLKVNEIANLVGYTDSRYFCKVFKKQTGMVPTQYKMESEKYDTKN